MRKLAVFALCLAFAIPALAAEKPAGSDAADAMKSWNPPKVKNEKKDRSEITALLKKLDTASKKGDLQAAMALIDFPVLMTTDNSKGEAMSEAWTADQYRQQMEPFFRPMPDMKVVNRPEVFLVTDSLATVANRATVTMGKKTVNARSALLLIRTGGEWKIKSMTEGGWGDMMAGGGAGSHHAAGEAPGMGGATGATGATGPSSTEPMPTTPPPAK